VLSLLGGHLTLCRWGHRPAVFGVSGQRRTEGGACILRVLHQGPGPVQWAGAPAELEVGVMLSVWVETCGQVRPCTMESSTFGTETQRVRHTCAALLTW